MFFAQGSAPGLCGECRQRPRPFRFAVAAAPYEGVFRRAVLELKFRRREPLARFVGQAAASAFRAAPRSAELGTAGPPPEAVVPMPLPRWRRIRRGFNQAALIARPVAAARELPLAQGILVRRWRSPQTTLSRSRRRRNPAGSFRIRQLGLPAKLLGRPLLLVDDVMTTGATAEAAVRCLRRAGAGPVDVLVVARTL